MGYIEYKKENIEQYIEDLKYWSNSCGELHYHGEYDLKEKDLPKELLRAYNELWSDGTGSLCYLVEYKGEYRIALINGFDEIYAEDINSTMDILYQHMKTKAEKFSAMGEFKNTQIIIAENAGCYEYYEFVVLLSCDTKKEIFDKIASILYEEVYL